MSYSRLNIMLFAGCWVQIWNNSDTSTLDLILIHHLKTGRGTIMGLAALTRSLLRRIDQPF
jgi:hypothetical protein